MIGWRCWAAVPALCWTTLAPGATGDSRTWLASWADGQNKREIVAFVESTTTPDHANYVTPGARIAVFDNDGTLWAEQPVYFQLAYALDRVEALAPGHPEWRERMPFKAVLEGEIAQVVAGGKQALLELIMATHAGMTTEAFSASVSRWLHSARHPVTSLPYPQMIYQPMLELLEYLRAHGYKTFIVSGGGIEFMRVFTEDVYGVPPEQVIGSSIVTEYELRNGRPMLVRQAEMNFVDDKAGKPVAINQHIGRRPVIAFGNSDGDFQMLEWTTAGQGPRLGVLIRHDDAERGWAYDRQSSIGRLDRGLDEAPRRGWLVISMQADWTGVFPTTRSQ